MKCPACEASLKEVVAGGVTVDICREGCGGIWFDAFELQKMDEQSENAGTELLELKKGVILHRNKRVCPRCQKTMVQHFFSACSAIQVDECPGCAGMWLDAGELAAIRNEYASEKERRTKADEFLHEVMKPFQSEAVAEHFKTDSRKKFARAWRFLCPSYYMPGKQEGGAF